MLKYGDRKTEFKAWLDHCTLWPFFKGSHCSYFIFFLQAFDIFLCRGMLKEHISKVYSRHSVKLFLLPCSHPGQNVITPFNWKGDSVQVVTNISVHSPEKWHSHLVLQWSLLATPDYYSFPCSFLASHPHIWQQISRVAFFPAIAPCVNLAHRKHLTLRHLKFRNTLTVELLAAGRFGLCTSFGHRPFCLCFNTNQFNIAQTQY